MAFDAAHMLDSRHPFYQHSAAAFFLAEEDGRDVGRLAVLDNAHYNTYNATRTAFFYLFESEPDRQAVLGLFSAASEWASSRGLPRFRGLGATALLFCELHDSVLAGGFDYADVVQIGAENTHMLNEIRGLEIDFNKTHRMFRRGL